MAEPSKKQRAWAIFDRIVEEAAEHPEQLNPWREDGAYRPDFETLQRLLGVPLYLQANTQSGVPALALDVWTSFELRRAGFAADSVWPRSKHPRVLPAPVARLLDAARSTYRSQLREQIEGAPIAGVVATSANILGKHYTKQVDVGMSSWQTGPEILISTKRMDSSFGKNAANRVEESYGDAKNLRSRHPIAALGFVYGLRSTILATEAEKARWLIDLLIKLGREDDAYDSVCLLMIEYKGKAPEGSDGSAADEDPLAAAGVGETTDAEGEIIGAVSADEVADALANLPPVKVLHEAVPAELQAGRFLRMMVEHVLDNTPITMHDGARVLRREAGLVDL